VAADGLTKIGFRVKTVITFAAFRRIKRDHMITNGNTGYTSADLANNPCAFMA
jgi:hypothetical protein